MKKKHLYRLNMMDGQRIDRSVAFCWRAVETTSGSSSRCISVINATSNHGCVHLCNGRTDGRKLESDACMVLILALINTITLCA